MKKLFENLFNNARRGGQEEIGHENLLSDDSEERQFDHDFRVGLIELEARLHNEEDNDKIVMAAIESAYNFYDADWTGILSTDYGSAYGGKHRPVLRSKTAARRSRAVAPD